MTRKSFYNVILTTASIVVLGISGFAQGKHGGGNKGGGGEHGNGNGGGQEMKQQRQEMRQQPQPQQVERGNGWGRQKHDDGGQQRAFEAQRQQQMQAARQQQQQWQMQRQQQQQNERAARQQNDWAMRQQREQQKQYERNAREQQEQYYRQQREQQRQAYRQVPQQYTPQPQYREPEFRKDNGRHLGWYKNGKAYTSDGMPYAATSDPRYARPERQYSDRNYSVPNYTQPYYQQRNPYTYYNNYADPIVNYLPVYQQQYYQPYGSTRENIIRSLIGSFLGGQPAYSPVYQSYQPYQGYQPYQAYTPYYGGYQQPYYQTASYSPAYGGYSPYYGQNGYGYDPSGYDPYGYQQPYYGTQMFGGGGLKSTLLNVGLSLLQGFLGNGYEQGVYQGEYARDYYRQPVNSYYDPYAAAEPAYYSPLASSFADQRQLLEEGYRLGYQDAMRDQNPYGNVIGNNAPVNLVSQFLANTLINRI